MTWVTYTDRSRWRAFENRIRKRLPSYHQKTGERLSWSLRLQVPGEFDPHTGKKIRRGLATLHVTCFLRGNRFRDARMGRRDFHWEGCKNGSVPTEVLKPT